MWKGWLKRPKGPPVNAAIDHLTGGEIIPHQNGLYYDIDEIVKQIVSAPARTRFRLTGIEVVPFLRSEHLRTLTHVLGDFSTPVLGSPDRVENIRLSLGAINNILLLPGEVFPLTKLWESARKNGVIAVLPLFWERRLPPRCRRGICQSSTTLYNAVREAGGLQIVERRIHSIAPSYIKHGLDATVAWPHTDFKFRNSKDTPPVIIKAAIQQWRVRVWVLGEKEG